MCCKMQTAFRARLELLSSASDAGSSHLVDLTASKINQLYLDVVGGVQKGKKEYGLATQTSGIYLEATAQRETSSGSRSTSAVTKADMEATLEEVRMYRYENSHLRDRIWSLEETCRKLVVNLEPGNKKYAQSIAPPRMWSSSSRGPTLVKFTHVSDTYDDDDGDDDDDFL